MSSPLAMAEGDVTGDGIPDTVYASASTTAGSSALTVSPRSAPSAPLTSIAAGTVPCTANSILLADLNKDQRLDAVVTCSDNNVVVMANQGGGTFTLAGQINFYGRKAQAADFNGDGFPDLVIQSPVFQEHSSEYVVVLNKGTAVPSFADPIRYSNGGGNVNPGHDQIVIADFDNDGKLDFITGADENDLGAWVAQTCHGNGDGTFRCINTNYLNGTIAAADFDGDGKVDVANYGVNPSTSSYVRIEFPAASKTAIKTVVNSGIVSLKPLDVNGDGKLDLVLAGPTTTILFGDGTGAFTLGKAYAAPGTFLTTRKGSLGVDLVFTTPAGFYTLRNDGKGNFNGLPSFYFTDAPIVADLNNDGLTDLAGDLINSVAGGTRNIHCGLRRWSRSLYHRSQRLHHRFGSSRHCGTRTAQ